jgi:polyhydroxyalkanoate synthesis regulator phasin
MAQSRSGGGRGGSSKAGSKSSSTSSSGSRARGARGPGVEAKTVAEFRDALRKNLIRPMDMVLLSRERIEEVLGEAVDQGRVTGRDARRIASGLLKRGQKETSDVLRDLEQLLERGRSELGSRAAGARGRAARASSPALAKADRARRAAGVGPSFPITGYDGLTAAQVQRRLTDLTPAQLRKVRDHERRNAKRKTILSAIESKLR